MKHARCSYHDCTNPGYFYIKCKMHNNCWFEMRPESPLPYCGPHAALLVSQTTHYEVMPV